MWIEALFLAAAALLGAGEPEDLAAVRIPEDAVVFSHGARPTSPIGESCRYVVGSKVVGEREWYRNGQLAQEQVFRDGKEHGISRQFHENGQLFSERPFQNGRLDGVARFWDEKGRLLGESVLKNGTGVLTRFGQSALSSRLAQFTYKDGKIDGTTVEWGRFAGCRGIGYSTATYCEGEMVGWVYLRDEDGTLLSFSHWKDGKCHGVSRVFDHDGKQTDGYPKFITTGYPKYYINGEDVSEAEFLAAAKTDKILAETLRHNPPKKETPRKRSLSLPEQEAKEGADTKSK